MDFSIATLLSNFTGDKSIAPKVLEKKLECDDDTSAEQLQIALDVLEKLGILSKERGRYRRETEEDVIEAKLRCSSKGFCFAIQDEDSAKDIYIRETNLNTAWNGDRVLVKVIKEGIRRRSPEGEVKVILERANPSVLARLKKENDDFRAVPLDDRLLFDIHVRPNGTDLESAIDYLVHVNVLRYPLGSQPPVGRVVQILGSTAEEADDIDIVCCKHDLPRQFPLKAIAADGLFAGDINDTDLVGRVDLREALTLAFSANHEGDTPIDRAISLQHQGNLWQLGIHFADIAHHLPADSPVDREALRRGTTIYLGDLVLPMLPENYRDRVGFVPDTDRLAISVLLKLNDVGDIIEYEIQPTVVRVDCQMSYDRGQEILDRTEESTFEGISNAVLDAIDQLPMFGQAFRDDRYQRGSFDLNLPDSSGHFDDEQPLGAVVLSSFNDIQAIVCELALLANQCVAKHLQALDVPALYCVHPSPDLADVQEAIKLAGNLGVELWLEDEETVDPSDFKQFVDQFDELDDEKILTYLLESTLKNSYYSTQSGPHFGLAIENGYTHFNAPLHRYPDLLLQRTLHQVFAEGRDRRTTRSKDSVNLRHSSCHGKISWNVLPPDIHQELESRFAVAAVRLTERERLAIEAEDDLEGLQKAGAMMQRTGEVFQGLITGVQSYGFFVEIESGQQGEAPSRLEGLVHVSSLKDDWYEYRSRQQTLVGRKNRKQFRLGDRVEVQVKSVDYYRQQIDLAPVSGGSNAESNGGGDGDGFEVEFE